MAIARQTTLERRAINEICKVLLEQGWSTNAIDLDRCCGLVASAYALKGLAVPEIAYCPSPVAAMNRLQDFGPRGISQSPRPVPDLQAVIADGTSLEPVLGIIGSAQPKVWAGLGGEVDLSFHWEVFSALDSIPWGSETWSSVKRRVAKKVSDLCHVAHTVNERLEAQVTTEGQAWLLYTQGASSLWAESVEYAALEVALALGYVSSAPDAFAIARQLHGGCAWIYSFEHLCLICDRPTEIHQVKERREVRTSITWRDGVRCGRVFS
jgi:hypothetical protein